MTLTPKDRGEQVEVERRNEKVPGIVLGTLEGGSYPYRRILYGRPIADMREFVETTAIEHHGIPPGCRVCVVPVREVEVR